MTPTLPRKRRRAMLARFLGTRRAVPAPQSLPALAAANLPALYGRRLEIVRDARGIPHVYADDTRDLYAALGWLQATDRFFAMDVLRHLAAGRMCGFVGNLIAPRRDPLFGGKRMADVDGFVRPFGFEAQSERDAARLSPRAAAVLEAYAAGVNAALRAMDGVYPPEYLFVGPVRPWRPADCLLAARACAFVISLTPFENELTFDAVRGQLGDAGARRLYPEAPWDAVPTTYRVRGDVPEPELPIHGTGGGSNNWAVGPARSATGAPIVANDPHVPFVPLPTFWHHVHLDGPGLTVQGGVFPGCPVFGLGHNGALAWGCTTGFRDAYDLYRIERIPGRPERYRTPSGTGEITRHEESMPARGGRTIRLRWQSCEHGVLYPGWRHHDGAELAVRLVPTDLARWFEGALALAASTTVDEHRAALTEMHEGPFDFNHVYGHRDGHIGWELYGRTPVRRRDGLFVRDAADPEAQWDGFVPFDAMPKQLAPARGFVATANGATDPSHTIVFTATHCEPRYRTNRIEALLAAEPAHTTETFAALQRDVTAAHTLAVRDAIVAMLDEPLGEPDGLLARAARVLRDWDGVCHTESSGTAIMALLQRTLLPRCFEPLLGPRLGARYDTGRRALPRLHALLLDPDDPVRADIERAAQRSLADLVRGAFAEAVGQLRAAQGPDPTRWRWGLVHRIWLGTVMAIVPGFGKPFVALDAPFPGEEYTLNPSRAVPLRGRLYAFVGATTRFICDLSRPDEALWAHSSGPSADPRTPYFSNLSAPWLRFEYFRSALWRADEIPDPVERLVVERPTA
ncbi:MAG TPA: penicillin acylase family protein [Candidatus Limnocylindria bacterium]|nr:penicillin acylase family protein [Candidatus Limnocylindria bacterium]